MIAVIAVSIGLLLAQDPGMVPAPVEPAPGPVASEVPAAGIAGPVPAEPTPPARRSRFAFAFVPSLTAGLSYFPSSNLAFFFGGRLPRGPWALGYQFTFSSGLADRYTDGLFFTHRHHVTAMRGFGARERGYLSLGGGAAFLYNLPVVEGEVKVGYRFGRRKHGVVGGLFRLGWDIGHREQAPVPQLGAFIGVAVF